MKLRERGSWLSALVLPSALVGMACGEGGSDDAVGTTGGDGSADDRPAASSGLEPSSSSGEASSGSGETPDDAADDTSGVDGCAGITCSEHGQCTEDSGTAACECDAGYVPDDTGLDCVPVDPNLDALGDCSAEPGLAGRSDIVFCEPWESDTWWSDHGFVANGAKNPPPVDPAAQLDHAELTDQGCLSGKCLRLHAPVGVTRSLAVHWPLAEAGLQPEELYFRYYLKLGPNWDPRQCDANGNEVWPPGGKFPGLADARTNADPSGQCGNGGASSDGVNCWTARGVFHGCEDTDASFPYSNTCEWVPGASTRIGSYLYFPDQTRATGSNGLWDYLAERQTMGPDFDSGPTCRRDDPTTPPEPTCYCKSEPNLFCGMGTGGMLVNDQWYAIEVYVKMNTPGQADGVLRGWVDGVLSYDKTDVRYRLPGHDNLHVRTAWLNVYKGGVNGNCTDGYVYLDNMVIATSEPIGPVP